MTKATHVCLWSCSIGANETELRCGFMFDCEDARAAEQMLRSDDKSALTVTVYPITCEEPPALGQPTVFARGT